MVDRVGPRILGTAAAEDAPREVEGDVATAGVETLRERTRGADGGRRQARCRGEARAPPESGPAARSAPRGSGS